MPRKSAAAELAVGNGPRQRVWTMIRAIGLGKPFERLEVMPGDINTDTARTYLSALENAGYIEQSGTREGAHKGAKVRLYTLVRDAGIEAPRLRKNGKPVTQGLAQEQMWRTLRMHKGDINYIELAAYASTPEIPVQAEAAKCYLYNLNQAGYLDCVKTGGAWRKGLSRYRLIKNTGPRPPMVCRADAVYDPNLGKTVWARQVTEEDAIYG